jgi:hypothetical protein
MSHLIYQGLDDQKEVSILFMDISKAFDRVWHSGLLYKLKTIGVDDNILEWFESYLRGRKQGNLEWAVLILVRD